MCAYTYIATYIYSSYDNVLYITLTHVTNSRIIHCGMLAIDTHANIRMHTEAPSDI